MAAGHAEDSHHDRTPAFLGGDLAEPERTALQEGHDADLRVGELQAKEQPTVRPASDLTGNTDLEKGDHERSELSSITDQKTANVATQVDPVDPNVVSWDGEQDPQNPMNWSSTVKWVQIGVLSFLTLLTPLASSMFAPGVPQLMRDFESNNDLLATFVVSIYVLGFAFGPLAVAPLSELYGRLIVYHVANVGFIAFTVGCALAPSLDALIVLRFFQGVLGVAPVTIGGGTIADLIVAEKRGGAMAIWAMGPLLGPVIGPVAGGFLSEAEGWR